MQVAPVPDRELHLLAAEDQLAHLVDVVNHEDGAERGPRAQEVLRAAGHANEDELLQRGAAQRVGHLLVRARLRRRLGGLKLLAQRDIELEHAHLAQDAKA